MSTPSFSFIACCTSMSLSTPKPSAFRAAMVLARAWSNVVPVSVVVNPYMGNLDGVWRTSGMNRCSDRGFADQPGQLGKTDRRHGQPGKREDAFGQARDTFHLLAFAGQPVSYTHLTLPTKR